MNTTTRHCTANLIRNWIIVLAITMVTGSCSSVSGPARSNLDLSEKPLVGKFVWHDLITDNVETAKHFYGELFGWTFENTTRPGSSDPYTLIRSGDVYVGGIVELDDPGDGTNFSRWLGYISVEDVETATRETTSAGGTVLIEPLTLPGIGDVAGIQDPQGAVVGIIRSKAGDPVDRTHTVYGEIVWNELVADDDQAAATFYAGLTGMQPEIIERRGGTYTLLNSGSTPRAGILRNPGSEFPPNWITHFSAANPIAASIRAIEAGGSVLIEPSPEFREGTQALMADPTGAIFMIQQL